ncbi:MAG TPA: hypothetical protein ACN46T_02110, partial [Prochlorococcus sp.]
GKLLRWFGPPIGLGLTPGRFFSGRCPSGRCPSGRCPSGRLGGATGRFGLGRPTSSGFGAFRSDGSEGLGGTSLRVAGESGLEMILGRGASPLIVRASPEVDV